MSNDVANDKEHRKQDSEVESVSQIFAKTSVCAISTILSTKSLFRRILWRAVFGLFTVAFFYQLFAFLLYVFQYHTIVSYESIRPESYVSPAYTFCNSNILKRSKFCEKYPRNCTRPNRELCAENPRFCGTLDTFILKSNIFDVPNKRELYEFNHGVEDMLDSKDAEKYDPIGPLPRHNRNEGTIGSCFSIFERVDSPLDPYIDTTAPIGMGFTRFFTFDPEENELVYPEAKSGIMFDIHSPFQSSNPFDTGVFMRPGYLYRIRVKMTQEELLPYECTNYTEVWLKNGKTGYRSHATCVHKCIGDEILKCQNCAEPVILYPYPNVTMCDPNHPKNNQECKNAFDLATDCFNECKEDCLKLKYSYEVQENFRMEYAHTAEKNESRKIRVAIEFPDSHIQKIVHKPQFLVLEVFSLIGGLLAFWIGLSMFQIIEVFDCVFQIAKNDKKKAMRSESSSA